MAAEDSTHQRILETLAVAAMIFTQVFTFLAIPLLVCYIFVATKYWWICVLYFVWTVIFHKDADVTGNWRSEWVRSWSWWIFAKNYYPLKLVKLPWGELDKKRNYIFCYFPHGMLSAGSYLTIATNATEFQESFPHHKAYIHTLAIFYKIPIIRELGLSVGGLQASKRALDTILGKEGGGNISALVVGGAEEARYCHPGVHKIICKKRKGFIKISLTQGAPLVPVYVFGENELFSQAELSGFILNKLRGLVKRTVGIPIVLPVGRKDMLGLVPLRRPLTVVDFQMAAEDSIYQGTLQTLAVVAMIFTQVGFALTMPLITCYIIFATKYWWICVLYFTWCYIFHKDADETGVWRSDWVRSWSWWVYAKNYYPLKLVKLPWGELDKKRNYLFCYFPHGILCAGSNLTIATNATEFQECFPHHKSFIHTIGIFYRIPILRELGLSMGGLQASKESLNNILSREGGGNISALVVGGAQEAYYCNPGVHKIVYKKRKGFIKIALAQGAPLVPVYVFGENELFSQSEYGGFILQKLRELVKKTVGISVIFPVGRKDTLGLVPRRRPLTTVVGKPIDVQKTENPTQEQIDHLHQLFQTKLVELFESQKKYYLNDHETAHLEIC